jgi:hypothetical protein
MDEPLNPISFEFFHRFLLYRATFNISFTLQLETILEPAHCESALRLVMQRHPILRSRVAIDLGSRNRYFWQQLPISAPLPLTWCQLYGSADDLPAAFSSLESDHQNCSLPLDRSVPFHLFIMPWQQRLTYLQLVASHTALDGKSLVLFHRDFLNYYWAVQQGQSPQVTPTPLGGDWSRLFAITLDARTKENLDRDILADQQTPPHDDDCHQSLGWPHLKATLARAKLQGATGQELVPFPRARLNSGADLAVGLRATVNTLAHRLSKVQTRALRQRLEDLALQSAEGGRPSLNELLSALYLQCQLTLARQAGESVAIAHLGMAVDLRPLCADKHMRESIQALFFPVVMTIDVAEQSCMELGKLVEAIQKKKKELLAAMPGPYLEKVWQRYRLGERVKSDRWLDFLATTTQIFHPQSARVVRVSYMGAIDKYFSRLSPFKLYAAKINTTNVGFPVPSLLLYLFQQQLCLSLTYVDAYTDSDQLNQLWQLFLQGLSELSHADAVYPNGKDA